MGDYPNHSSGAGGRRSAWGYAEPGNLGVSEIMGTVLEVPVLRTIVFWGLYWGPPILRN